MSSTASTGPRADLAAEDFAHLTEPFRQELLAHCYRMLGSVHDAEDMVQETFARAWRSYAGFEGRSSLRTWLYRIATTACLRAMEQRSRRPLPSGLGDPSMDPEVELVSQPDVPWLQPIPDSLIPSAAADPAAISAARETIRLALVAALQHLPARQRAVLLLREVLRWRASEVADLLDTSSAAVNSALQRARDQLARLEPHEDRLAEPTEPERRALLDRYVAAFENADLADLTTLLRDDVVLEMPPYPIWFRGVESCRRFLARRIGGPGDLRLLPIRANGQSGFAHYRREADGTYRGYGVLHVVTMSTSGIARMTAFVDPTLFATFDLPETLPAP
ncbi:MAG: sigma-70 family RNA polymerase sigma factor [Propionibacteriales bacterium]|nr:sigma-70 family RNA polymerase sigma factor [Propionibacteriales bacterium]